MMVFYDGCGTWFKQIPNTIGGNKKISYETWVTGLFILPERCQIRLKHKGTAHENLLLPCYDHIHGITLKGYTRKDAIYFMLGKYTNDGEVDAHVFTKEDVIQEEEQQQQSHKSTDTNPLDDLSTWQDFKKKAEQAIDTYPEWENYKTRKIQKSHLEDFIKPITSNTREIELIKRFLSEKYKI